MLNVVRWMLAVFVVVLVVGPPVIAYRYQYIHAKRFREVTPDRVYRSGQMTAAGFRETIDRYRIKTVINLQHENRDPLLVNHWLGKGTLHESELCKQLGVTYILLTPDLLPPNNRLDLIPPAVDDFLKIMDDESNSPVLLHCKAGLHRTGKADCDLPNGVSGLVGGRGALANYARMVTALSRRVRRMSLSSSSSRTTSRGISVRSCRSRRTRGRFV